MIGNSLDSSDVSGKSNNSVNTVKFLCSYGGMILPRQTDGKLRYVGGEIRVLAVDRSVTFSELLVKLGELCGSSVSLRCQLPNEDLDALVSITSDEDLAILIEEYDRASRAASVPLKIKAFLSTPKSIKKISPPPSATSTSTAGGYRKSILPGMVADRCVHQISKTAGFPLCFEKFPVTELRYYTCLPQVNPRHVHLVSNGKPWK